jgi:hypothetical protein
LETEPLDTLHKIKQKDALQKFNVLLFIEPPDRQQAEFQAWYREHMCLFTVSSTSMTPTFFKQPEQRIADLIEEVFRLIDAKPAETQQAHIEKKPPL